MTLRQALLTLLLLTIPIRVVRAADAVRFTIETISVEGAVHASPRIIVAESRLREGQTYSESELRDATSRIDRLPFVLNSDLRLARGTAPGRYVLIITIHETKPLFISALSRSFWTHSFRITGPSPSPGMPPEDEFIQDFHNNQATVGGRWFTGAKGMAYVATDIVVNEAYNNATPQYATIWRYHAGFTQYDLFGTRASLTAIVSYQDRMIRGIPNFDNDINWKARDDLSYQLIAVAPIAANQSILASFEWHTDPITYAGPPAHIVTLHTRPLNLNSQQLAWRFDTTDDPLFPTAGTLLLASVTRDKYGFFDNGNVLHLRYNNEEQATAERFWTITPLQSVSAGVDYDRLSVDEFRPHVGYSISLWTRDRTLRLGDLRADIEVERLLVSPFHSRNFTNDVRAGLGFRNEWGVIRATFQYSGWGSQ